MQIVCKKVQTVNEFIDAIRIRVDVFIKEQNYEPGWEPDDEDKNSEHYIAVVNSEIVSTVRVREPEKGVFKIERMATKKDCRKKGIGGELINHIIESISKKNPKKIWMKSQVQAQQFYEKYGFRITSPPYDLHGVPHVDMEYKG